MALPVTDDFTGAAAALSDPPYHNAHVNMPRLDGSGNCVRGASGSDDLAKRNDNTFTTGQSVEATLSANLSAGHKYLYLLVNVTGDDVAGVVPGYWFWTDGNGDTVLQRGAGGSESA